MREFNRMLWATSRLARKQNHAALPWAEPLSTCAQLRDGPDTIFATLRQHGDALIAIFSPNTTPTLPNLASGWNHHRRSGRVPVRRRSDSTVKVAILATRKRRHLQASTATKEAIDARVFLKFSNLNRTSAREWLETSCEQYEI